MPFYHTSLSLRFLFCYSFTQVCQIGYWLFSSLSPLSSNNLWVLNSPSLYLLGSVVRNNGTCDTENRRFIGITQETFHKLKVLSRNSKISKETKKRVLKYNVIVIHTISHTNECWTMFFTDEEKTWRDRDAILQTAAENTMDRTKRKS